MAKIDKFDMQDREVIAMCNARRQREEMELHQARVIEAEYEVIDPVAEAGAVVLRTAAGTLGRMCIGFLFMGAISRGWVEPAFGFTATAACMIWAGTFLRRCSHGNG